jgi:hypothetical protein
VQWCCETAAEKRTADAILEELRRLEVCLIKRLSWLGETAGVIGLIKQEDLCRIPSEIYWNGLGNLGLRRVQCNRQRWAWTVTVRWDASRETLWGDDKGGQEKRVRRRAAQSAQGLPGNRKALLSLTLNEAAYLRERLTHGSVDGGGEGLRFNASPTGDG